MVVGDSREAGVGEGSGVVGETRRAEAGEDAEGQVECANNDFCWKAHGAGGNAEVGDQPEGPRGKSGDDSGGQGFEVGLGKAVEEEVGDDEVKPFSLGG